MGYEYKTFALGDVLLQGGATLRDATLAYETYGSLNSERSNAIVYPTWYGGRHWDNEWLIGEGMGLDPSKYFIIVPNMLGNGLSSSPSNTASPFNGPRFPNITFYDQVACQHALVTQHFGIETLELVLGWSMGAGQAYQWGVSYPGMMKSLLPFCGSAVTSPHNKVFIDSVRAALTTDNSWNGGWYRDQPERGLRAAGRVYAGWGFSQAFYWQEEWRKLGFSSLEDFIVGFWEFFFLDDRDANDMLAMLWTWEHGDVGKTPGFDGDTEAALRSIRAQLISMPGSTDLYFPPEDEMWSSSFIPSSEVRVIPSVWGHLAGRGPNQPDTDFINAAVKELLARH